MTLSVERRPFYVDSSFTVIILSWPVISDLESIAAL